MSRVSALLLAGMATFAAQASFSDSFEIPNPDANARVGALMPYTRYDSKAASIGGGARLVTANDVDPYNIASQGSDRDYIKLPSSGAYAEWTVAGEADGVTMRFTMPDSADGMGQNGSLDIYVNGAKDQTVDLTSYFMYQYFSFYSGTPSDTPNGQISCFAFDEVHFKLNKAVKAGDKIKVMSSGANGLEYGVDFIEIEKISQAIGQPAGSISVTDFGARANDGQDDMDAFRNAMSAAAQQGKTLYIPAGTFHLSDMWHVYGNGIKITGAGIWHTNLKFTNPNVAGGGISGGSGNPVCDCNNVEICHFYVNSSLRSRYNENAIYKCFMDVFANGSVIHDVWEDHFECGFWMADYNGSMEYCDNLKIINCRIRNNLADGVNFCQGTSNATVYNCSIRNCGDDGLAMWNNSYNNAKDETDNVFAYNSIDLIWRAGAIAIYGGDRHCIYNNYIRDTFMASGIHFNTTFPGYKFDNTKWINFENNILVNTGTNKDCWNEDLAGIDIKESVKNVNFVNTRIYDSPFYAIRVMTGPSNIKFDKTEILGAGLTQATIEYSCVGHTACAIRLHNDNINFTGGVTIGNVGRDAKGNNSTWPVWTDNNQSLASKIGYNYTENSYTTPGYPTADSIQTGGISDEVNPYAGWYIGLGYGWNDWQEESFEVHPNAEGIAEFPAMDKLGSYFRIRMYDASTNSAVTLYGPEISEPGKWYYSDRKEDISDGAFHVTNTQLCHNVKVTVDVPNNRVKVTNANEDEVTPIHVTYDNSKSKWTQVRSHIWNAEKNIDIDIDLVRQGNSETWLLEATIGFRPTNILFYNGTWGGDNQTPDWEFVNWASYLTSGPISGVEAVDDVEEGAPVYYNLQGVRVDTPTSGIYIRVTGNSAKKVMVK